MLVKVHYWHHWVLFLITFRWRDLRVVKHLSKIRFILFLGLNVTNSAGITFSLLLLCWRCFCQTLNHTNISPPRTNYNTVSYLKSVQVHFNRNRSARSDRANFLLRMCSWKKKKWWRFVRKNMEMGLWINNLTELMFLQYINTN